LKLSTIGPDLTFVNRVNATSQQLVGVGSTKDAVRAMTKRLNDDFESAGVQQHNDPSGRREFAEAWNEF
jgi:hypothetical protein